MGFHRRQSTRRIASQLTSHNALANGRVHGFESRALTLLTLTTSDGVQTMRTIRDVMTDYGFNRTNLEDWGGVIQEQFDSFSTWDVDSHCGQECVKLVVLAMPLIDASDPASHSAIWYGIVSAMAVVCYG